jgi:chromosome segregation ATPase
VSELERDLGTTTTDLATADRQFSQVTNQLQVVSEEATQLRKSNAKLSQDLEGELSVRNVVPTLTSNKRQGLSLNGRCQAIRDRVYPGSG